jgi:hypothetical protein
LGDPAELRLPAGDAGGFIVALGLVLLANPPFELLSIEPSGLVSAGNGEGGNDGALVNSGIEPFSLRPSFLS